MKSYFGTLGWAAVALLALVCLNLVFFGFVVGLDVMFGEAPQLTVPMFLPLLFCCGMAVMLFLGKRWREREGAEATMAQASAQTSAPRSRRPRRAVLHSMLIIRRQSNDHFNARERRVYESTA